MIEFFSENGKIILQFFMMYITVIFVSRWVEIKYRFDLALNQKYFAQTLIYTFDIFLYIVFYPVYWITDGIESVDYELGQKVFRYFQYFCYIVFSPILLVFQIWLKVELYLDGSA